MRLWESGIQRSISVRRVIGPNERVDARLAAGDPAIGGSHYHDYLYNAFAGETLTFRVASTDFDSHLTIGRQAGDSFYPLGSDDDGGGGLDARLEVTFPTTGVYVVRVASLDKGTGDYTLNAGGAPVLTLGETLRGEITGAENEIEDGHYSDEYEYVARKGETIVIDLSSSDFDVLVYVGEQMDDDFRILASDDDGAGGTNSRLEFTFPEEGFYYIGVTSAGEEETGDYTLRVRAK